MLVEILVWTVYVVLVTIVRRRHFTVYIHLVQLYVPPGFLRFRYWSVISGNFLRLNPLNVALVPSLDVV